MRLFGIGIDVVEVERIEASIARSGEPFLAKVFTAAERAYCEGKKRPAIHFAARFAAKEAVAKAFGTGIGGRAGLLEIEVAHDDGGAPKVVLTGAARKFADAQGIAEVQISLTHTARYAAANAIALC
ncbi:MAG: holo-ACP synthase [Verrucomicrobiales bacterium]|nr:holo-ACP synthase [Verrucomicrobiota bacterium JB025]